MQTYPQWQYNEFKHLATDFHDPQQVKTYDARQHTNIENEKRLVKELGMGTSHTVIEYGSGTGGFTLAAAKTCKQVYSVDISEAMLDYARSHTAAVGLTNIEFIQAGFLTYTHRGEPVDYIVTKFAFHHLPDFWKSIALQKMNKFLKPDGLLVLEDVVFSFAPQQYEEHLQNWIDTQSSNGQSFSKEDFEGHIRDEHSTFAWVLEGLLREAGFGIEQVHYWSPIYAHYRCRKIR
jgi:ubiquinone/menaquinone biosynthesis C-methylase UbiE